MVLLRSIFWLTAAYFIIGPNVNVADTVNKLSAQTLQGAKQMVAGQLDNMNCASLQCSGAKAVIAASLNSTPKTAPEKIYEQTESTIPVPRPRLMRTG